MIELLTPLLTELDPTSSTEGTLDPLGLYPLADSLGVKLVPGVRQRQSHPRYMTAMAIGEIICSDFDEEVVAVDGVSEPWQVFEWYMVEGLVRTLGESREITGLPGREKTRRAIRDGRQLSAQRYLKTPTVFGFHGVYRVLAEALDIISGGSLGETGYNLITTWEREQGLQGFATVGNGHGHSYRQQIANAVNDGLQKGAVSRKPGWNGWEFFSTYLSPVRFGKKETNVIFNALADTSTLYRHKVINFLISEKGQNIWLATNSERAFHEELKKQADEDLRALLDAITSYEEFSRLLQDAFDDCLFIMSQNRGKTSLQSLVRSECVQSAAKKIHILYRKVAELLTPFDEALRFENAFASFSDNVSPASWIEILIDHHLSTQKSKPPNGKLPWFERYEDGGLIIRPAYIRDEKGKADRSYLQRYRTGSLWTFMQDLRRVPS